MGSEIYLIGSEPFFRIQQIQIQICDERMDRISKKEHFQILPQVSLQALSELLEQKDRTDPNSDQNRNQDVPTYRAL
jgi:hypothetical protein